MDDKFVRELEEHQKVMADAVSLEKSMQKVVSACVKALEAGRKLLWCGNGGSAADAQHLAAEFVVRFRRNRVALASIALTTDASALTATGNDFSFDQVFARQVEALGQSGDVLFAISTSGTSPNVINAAIEAKARGLVLVTITGSKKNPLEAMADLTFTVPSENTARIQECYMFLGHLLCEEIESTLFD